MLIFGAFEYSLELEEALGELERSGIKRKDILAIPMDTYLGSSKDSINEAHDFYSKAFEVGAACATGCSVIGTSIGFILNWGPIIWGLIAAAIGLVVGWGLYFLFHRKAHRSFPKRIPEVIIVVKCSKEQSDLVMEIMGQYDVLTMGRHIESSS